MNGKIGGEIVEVRNTKLIGFIDDFYMKASLKLEKYMRR